MHEKPFWKDKCLEANIWQISIAVSLHIHQWNTRWAFARKHDILTCYNDMSSLHMKRSALLLLHNKSHHLQQKNSIEMVWYLITVYTLNRTLHGHLDIRNFSFCVEDREWVQYIYNNYLISWYFLTWHVQFHYFLLLIISWIHREN